MRSVKVGISREALESCAKGEENRQRVVEIIIGYLDKLWMRWTLLWPVSFVRSSRGRIMERRADGKGNPVSSARIERRQDCLATVNCLTIGLKLGSMR